MNLTVLFALFMTICAALTEGKRGLKKKGIKKLGSCRDLRDDCGKFKNWNWCVTRKDVMKRICAVTCDICTVKKCKDLRGDCHYLSSLGWCKAQRRSMSQICPKTCKLCPRKGKKTTPHTKAPSATERPSTIVVTTKRATTMAPTTRRATTIKITTTEPDISSKCKDKRPDCDTFARLRWCKVRKIIMSKVCPETCKLCSRNPPKQKTVVQSARPHLQTRPPARPSTRQSTRPSTHPPTKLPTRQSTRPSTRLPTRQSTTRLPTRQSTPPTIRQTTTVYVTRRRPITMKRDVHCRDLRSDCHYLSTLSFCRTRRMAMIRVCSNTCGFCSGNALRRGHGRSMIRIRITHKPTQPPTTRPSNKFCVDIYGTPRCEYYKYIGWCDKDAQVAKYCFKTCKCSKKHFPTACHLTTFGCCWDKRTPKRNPLGLGCPACEDDPRFIVLCDRFRAACAAPGGLGDSVRRYCPRKCNFCF